VAEWLKALVLKINVSKDTVSSNLTLPVYRYLFVFMSSLYSVEKKIRLNLKNSNKSDLNLDTSLSDKGFYVLYIKGSLRGLHINVSNNHGKVIKLFSAGKLGFKKAQRHNQVSLQVLTEEVIKFLQEISPKLTKLNIVLKGFSVKRKKVIKFILKSSIKPFVASIIDLSDIPYNGCRPKKLRRK
jgi:ribosomal protein S11